MGVTRNPNNLPRGGPGASIYWMAFDKQTASRRIGVAGFFLEFLLCSSVVKFFSTPHEPDRRKTRGGG
jgi:hypothetical protein